MLLFATLRYSQGSVNLEPAEEKLKNSTNSFEKVVLTPFFCAKKKIKFSFSDIEPIFVAFKDLKLKKQPSLIFVKKSKKSKKLLRVDGGVGGLLPKSKSTKTKKTIEEK